MPFVNEKNSEGVWQTIDRSRGITLTLLEGGRSDYPFRFRLDTSEGTIHFEAYQRYIEHHLEDKNLKNEIEWQHAQIFAPGQDKGKYKAIIAEALDAFGFAGGEKHEFIGKVSIEFMP